MYGMNYGYQGNYQPQTDERIWVQNEQSAEAYLVAPNSFVRLWDAQKPIFYEKRADASGRPLPLEVYEYSKRQRTMPTEALVNAEGINEWRKDLEALTRRIEALNANKVEALKDRISEQNQQINALQLSASQARQNAYLIDQLGQKCPIPAYLTCNPNAPLNYSVNYGCGCNA